MEKEYSRVPIRKSNSYRARSPQTSQVPYSTSSPPIELLSVKSTNPTPHVPDNEEPVIPPRPEQTSYIHTAQFTGCVERESVTDHVAPQVISKEPHKTFETRTTTIRELYRAADGSVFYHTFKEVQFITKTISVQYQGIELGDDQSGSKED